MAKYMKVQKCDKGILPDRQLAVTNGEAARMLGVSAHACQLASGGTRP